MENALPRRIALLNKLLQGQASPLRVIEPAVLKDKIAGFARAAAAFQSAGHIPPDPSATPIVALAQHHYSLTH